MRIAIVGNNLALNTQLATVLSELTGFNIIEDDHDEMMQLLNLNPEKYFNAFQLHVLLERCRRISKLENLIICDSLQSDICTVIAAESTGIISEYESSIYKKKHKQYSEYLASADIILAIESKNINLQEISLLDIKKFPLSFYQECYREYEDKFNVVKKNSGDKFHIIDVEQMKDLEYLRSLLFKKEHLEVKESLLVDKDIVCAEDPVQTLEEQFLSELKQSQREVKIVKDSDEIKTLLNSFHQGEDLGYERYAAMEDEKIVCLRLFVVEEEPTIECKVFSKVPDALAFLR